MGAESVPKYLFLARNHRLSADMLAPFIGEKVVLKVVSADVVHKTEMGGVKIVSRLPGKVRSESRRMIDRVTGRFAAFFEKYSDPDMTTYANLYGQDLRTAVNKRIQGVLITQFMPPESDGLGNELLVSLRWTREFGMVITAGLGGTDTNLYAQRFRLGQAVISASTAQVSGEEFFDLFRNTIAYEKLSGQTRGAERLVSDEQLLECFGAFISVGNYFSPLNDNAPFVIEELEVNPFAIVDYEMAPLDGLCTFCTPFRPRPNRGLDRIGHLLQPDQVAIIGVSAVKLNFGRNILQNLIQAGYPKKQITIVSPTSREIDGVQCVPDITAVSDVDLMIIAVGARHVPDLMDEIIDHDRAESVILISSGMGETEDSRDQADAVVEKIIKAHSREAGGPVFLGGNCMGIVSRPGRIDSFFTPEACSPKRRTSAPSPVALISQSGAFSLVRMTGLVAGDPAYIITVGNQMDLTIGDFITWFADVDDVDVICVYAEGFRDLDGLHACQGVRKAVDNGKEVIVYKAGRTPEGKKATTGHTASIAGDYMVSVSCLTQAGALVAATLEEYDGLMNLSVALHNKAVCGNRIVGISPAGFESVGIADSLESLDSSLELSVFSPETRQVIADQFEKSGLAGLAAVKNPLDLTPAASDDVYLESIKALINDGDVDAIVTSLGSLAPATTDTPAVNEPEGYISGEYSFATKLPDLINRSPKPIVIFNDAGRAHEPINNRLRQSGVPVFATCSQAMTLLARYTAYRIRIKHLREQKANTLCSS